MTFQAPEIIAFYLGTSPDVSDGVPTLWNLHAVYV
jgi:hypothetical protein